jgi:hypothetical protein
MLNQMLQHWNLLCARELVRAGVSFVRVFILREDIFSFESLREHLCGDYFLKILYYFMEDLL